MSTLEGNQLTEEQDVLQVNDSRCIEFWAMPDAWTDENEQGRASQNVGAVRIW